MQEKKAKRREMKRIEKERHEILKID